MGICRPEDAGADDEDDAVDATAAVVVVVVGMDTVADAVMVGESESERRDVGGTRRYHRRLKDLWGGWSERRPEELDKNYPIRLSVACSCWWYNR